MKALITWWTKGIGFSIAKELTLCGYEIVLTYFHDEVAASKASAALLASWASPKIIKADTGSRTDLQNVFKQVNDDINVLVNNIGSAFPDDDGLDWDTMFHYHMMWTVYATEFFAQQLKGEGNIINITSVAWSNPWARHRCMRLEAYCCMKAAVEMYTKICANKYKWKIWVNAVSPGNTQTPWREWADVDFVRARERNSCINRFVEPSEIAKASVAIIQNRWINGQIITVDGGEVARGYELQ